MLAIDISDRFSVVGPSEFSAPWLVAFTTLAQHDNRVVDFKAGSCEAQRRELESCLAPLAVTWLTLEHKATVVDINQEAHYLNSPVADAAIVSRPGSAVAFTTADCLPIVCFSEKQRVAAGIHAGWRSLAAGIVEAVIARLNTEYSVHPASLKVWIGPSIGKDDYEVSDTVRTKLLIRPAVAEDCFQPVKPGHWLADLAGAATAILTSLGIVPNNVERYPVSTKRSPLLHSARRDGDRAGRMATVVGIKE